MESFFSLGPGNGRQALTLTSWYMTPTMDNRTRSNKHAPILKSCVSGDRGVDAPGARYSVSARPCARRKTILLRSRSRSVHGWDARLSQTDTGGDMCFVCPSKTDRCGILGAPENIFSGISRTFSLAHCHAEPEIPSQSQRRPTYFLAAEWWTCNLSGLSWA